MVIALTASALEEDKAVILSSGCDDFMRKPFQQSEIFEMLQLYLGVRYIYDELETKTNLIPTKTQKLTAQDVVKLPNTWLADVHQATLEGDISLIQSLIEQIRPQYESIATGFANLASQYDFEQLLTLTKVG